MLRLVTFASILCLCVMASPAQVLGQTSSAESISRQTPSAPGFLTNYRFHLNALRLASNNENFVWDTDFGGDLDVFDLHYFRGNLLVNFESIVGHRLRPIDPNQGNYTIDLSTWWRTTLPGAELGATLHHVSRHRSDRDKDFAIAWNMLGFQYTSQQQIGMWSLEIEHRLLKTIRRSFVDYTAEIGGSARTVRSLHRWVSLVFAGEVSFVPVDRSERGRDNQFGGRLEIGARFPSGAGAGEVFVARERRIDADPFDRQPTNFIMVGFRFLSR
jgi:hypothetical protein